MDMQYELTINANALHFLSIGFVGYTILVVTSS